MSLTDEQKKQLAKLAGADYGIPGSGYDSLRSGISIEPIPGTDSTSDLLNSLRQLAFDLTREKRLDDGFRGERLAKIIHMETRDFLSVPDKLFVKELLENLSEEDRTASMNEIVVFYAIPTGGTTVTNVIPEALGGQSFETVSEIVDYQKILNYPRFYALGTQLMDAEINIGDFVYVEIKDYVEYSYGTYIRPHGSSYITSGGGPEGFPAPNPPGGTGLRSSQPGAPFVDTGAKVTYDLASYELDNGGGFIGASTSAESVKSDPITDEMAAANGACAGISKYGALPHKLRKDISPFFHNIVNELREQGAAFHGAGSLIRVGSRFSPAKRIARGGSPTSLHFVGRAIDLHTGAGCLADSKALRSLRSVNFNADLTPAYAYYISPNGPRRYVVYAVSKDPTVPVKEILAMFAGYSGGSEIFLEKVRGRFIDVNAVMAKHGFRIIREHKGNTPLQDVEKECMGPNGSAALSEGGRKTRFTKKWSSAYLHTEWWHFQFTGDLVKHSTTYGSQLSAILSRQVIEQDFGGRAGVKFWGGRKNTRWDDPRATYLSYWG